MGTSIRQQPPDLVAVRHHHADDIAVLVQLVYHFPTYALRHHLNIGTPQQRKYPQHCLRHAALADVQRLDLRQFLQQVVYHGISLRFLGILHHLIQRDQRKLLLQYADRTAVTVPRRLGIPAIAQIGGVGQPVRRHIFAQQPACLLAAFHHVAGNAAIILVRSKACRRAGGKQHLGTAGQVFAEWRNAALIKIGDTDNGIRLCRGEAL